MKSKILCIEIGPGLGTLTSSLLKKFECVLAIEFDKKLAENLPMSFPGKKLSVINQDFLQFDLEKIEEPYVVAGNIPYCITSPIIDKLLNAKNKPLKIVLLIQKEVAEKILETDGKHSFLSLNIKNLAEAEAGPVTLFWENGEPKLSYVVTKDYFTPPPKVDSAVVVLRPRAKSLVDAETMKMIRLGFLKPRKKLVSNLGGKKNLEKVFAELKIDLNARAADLDLLDWQSLTEKIRSEQ